VDGLEVELLVPGAQCTEDALRNFNCHVAVSSLSRLRADLLVIEQHDHVDLGVVALLERDLRALHKRIERAEGAGKVVKAGRRDKFLVKAKEAGRLRVVAAELEVDDLFALNLQISSDQLSELAHVTVVKLESVFIDN